MTFEPNWESLKAYEVPEWFQDAKLGIFIHWGAYAVPAFQNEWYPRNMYRRGQPEFDHHLEVWGKHKDFGYKDFLPLFKAGNWDPQAWVALFKAAGARYVVPVAEHHDGIAMYGTDYTPWNVVNKGPHRDIVSELSQAVREAGLKFGVSSHRANNWRFFTYEEDFDTVDPENAGIYSPKHDDDAPATPEWLEDWYARTCELVDKFDPDVLWFDFGWHKDEFAPYRPMVTAYYYNKAAERGYEPVLQYKDKFPEGVAVFDMERGKLDKKPDFYWQTDTSVSYKSWCYIEDDEWKSVTTLVHDLVDIVSKNGNLLLNIGPRPDGTIPQEAQKRLLGLGEWLKVNGEAIYGTRPWTIYGEGNTPVVTGHLTEQNNAAFGAEDIRFTSKDGILYAIALGWPEDGELSINSLSCDSPICLEDIEMISMLGSNEALAWCQSGECLRVTLPREKPCDHAYTLKIQLTR